MILAALTFILIALFAVSGVAKLRTFDRTSESFLGFGLSRRWAKFFVIVVSVWEIVLAFAMLLGVTRSLSLLGACITMAFFSVLLSYRLIRHDQFVCNCFGSIGSSRVTWRTVARNVLVLCVALAGFLATQEVGVLTGLRTWWPQLDISTAVAIVSLVLAIISIFVALLCYSEIQKLASEMSNEQNNKESISFEQKLMTRPMLNDRSGQAVSLYSIRVVAPVMYLLFVSATCSHCYDLLQELALLNDQNERRVASFILIGIGPMESFSFQNDLYEAFEMYFDSTGAISQELTVLGSPTLVELLLVEENNREGKSMEALLHRGSLACKSALLVHLED